MNKVTLLVNTWLKERLRLLKIRKRLEKRPLKAGSMGMRVDLFKTISTDKNSNLILIMKLNKF